MRIGQDHRVQPELLGALQKRHNIGMTAGVATDQHQVFCASNIPNGINDALKHASMAKIGLMAEYGLGDQQVVMGVDITVAAVATAYLGNVEISFFDSH